MFMLQAVRHRSFLIATDPSDIRRQRQEFRERWHALRQYKCDPWQEMEVFAHKLDRPARDESGCYGDSNLRHRAVSANAPFWKLGRRSIDGIQFSPVL